MIVRWGLGELADVLDETGIRRPLLISSERWRTLELPIPLFARFHGVRPHAEREGVEAARELAAGADGLIALGGGSAIDTAKAVSADMGLPLVSLPTTYSGAEWTSYFGSRDAQTGRKGGGSGARLAGIVYEPRLTLDLPREATVGTAMNALAHCAEALYVRNRNEESDRHALAGADLISSALPRVVAAPRDAEARARLLAGACEAGAAIAGSGLGLGHALAQALGGRYGVPHGALNAICLPPALRFNLPAAGAEIARFGQALRTPDPIARVEELARLGGFKRLRDLGIPRDELELVAEATAARPAMRQNPRSASVEELTELLSSVW